MDLATRTRGLVAVAAIALATAVATPAHAVAPSPIPAVEAVGSSRPHIDVQGATSSELHTILASWDRLLGAFPRLEPCTGAVTVRVVERAEDHYGGPVTSSIAAFYRFPPEATVFIERGKVNADNLIHEFAHHLDLSCGLSGWQFGGEFLRAQGFPVSHSWIQGRGWSGVPAEHFAEAVVAHLGVADPDIAISATARRLVDGLARDPLLVV